MNQDVRRTVLLVGAVPLLLSGCSGGEPDAPVSAVESWATRPADQRTAHPSPGAAYTAFASALGTPDERAFDAVSAPTLFVKGVPGQGEAVHGYRELARAVARGLISLPSDPGSPQVGFTASGVSATDIRDRFAITADDVAWYTLPDACADTGEDTDADPTDLGIGLAHDSIGWQVISVECS